MSESGGSSEGEASARQTRGQGPSPKRPRVSLEADRAEPVVDDYDSEEDSEDYVWATAATTTTTAGRFVYNSSPGAASPSPSSSSGSESDSLLGSESDSEYAEEEEEEEDYDDEATVAGKKRKSGSGTSTKKKNKKLDAKKERKRNKPRVPIGSVEFIPASWPATRRKTPNGAIIISTTPAAPTTLTLADLGACVANVGDTPTIYSLPTLALTRIFRYCDSRSLVAVEGTCKLWSKVVQDSGMWEARGAALSLTPWKIGQTIRSLSCSHDSPSNKCVNCGGKTTARQVFGMTMCLNCKKSQFLNKGEIQRRFRFGVRRMAQLRHDEMQNRFGWKTYLYLWPEVYAAALKRYGSPIELDISCPGWDTKKKPRVKEEKT
ncbi:hypothetical protein Pelo_1338 [Pelomyxa schiedti]|nr:hypothetical protein Pelo_1338 [Pelomyxa schiedti]